MDRRFLRCRLFLPQRLWTILRFCGSKHHRRYTFWLCCGCRLAGLHPASFSWRRWRVSCCFMETGVAFVCLPVCIVGRRIVSG